MDKISIHMKQMNATVIVIVKAISGDSDIGDKHLPIHGSLFFLTNITPIIKSINNIQVGVLYFL
jgi:hypothetical protein